MAISTADSSSSQQQIMQAVLDEQKQSLRVSILNDDICVVSCPHSVARQAAVSHVSPSDLVVIEPFSVVAIRDVVLSCATISDLSSSTRSFVLDVSPSDSDDVWLPAVLTVSPSVSASSVVVASSGFALKGMRRARVRTMASSPGVSGSAVVYVNGIG